MNKTTFFKTLPLFVLGSGLLLTVAFAQTTGSKQKAISTDTVPTKQKKIRDLDEALSEIDRGEVEMQKALKEVDRERLEADIRKAMKDVNIDMAKMKEEMAKAMKDVDMQKISLEVQKAMKDIDCEKLKQDVAASLSKVDMQKMKADLEKAKIEIEKTKEIDLSKMKEELANLGPQVEKAMAEAHVSIEKARVEITAYKNLVNALDKDGLLDKSGQYKIEYKNNELTVNGKKLSAEATRKYSEFLQGKKNFTLQKSSDGLDIDNQQ